MNLNLNILKTVILRKWIQSPLLPIVLVFIIAVGVATFFSVRLANKSAVSGFKLFTESLTGESDFTIRSPSGLFNEETIIESLMCFKRAGASAIVSYFSLDIAKKLET